MKNSDKVRREDLSALKSFVQDYPEAETVLLYRGNDRFVRDGIIVIPCDEFIAGI